MSKIEGRYREAVVRARALGGDIQLLITSEPIENAPYAGDFLKTDADTADLVACLDDVDVLLDYYEAVETIRPELELYRARYKRVRPSLSDLLESFKAAPKA